MNHSWDIRHDKLSFLSFWVIFCPLTFLTIWTIKIFKKMKKKMPENISTTNDDQMMYDSWDMEYHRQNFLSFRTIFCHFTPPNNPENQNSEKMKKVPVDITILHRCTINENHMMHVSWDMEHDRHIFFSFWTIFCPFNPLTTQKIKILNKRKKCLQISLFHTSVP